MPSDLRVREAPAVRRRMDAVLLGPPAAHPGLLFAVRIRINGDASVTGYCPPGLRVFCITYRELNVTC